MDKEYKRRDNQHWLKHMMKKIKAEKLWRILPGIGVKSKSILKGNEID